MIDDAAKLWNVICFSSTVLSSYASAYSYIQPLQPLQINQYQWK